MNKKENQLLLTTTTLVGYLSPHTEIHIQREKLADYEAICQEIFKLEDIITQQAATSHAKREKESLRTPDIKN